MLDRYIDAIPRANFVVNNWIARGR